MDWIERADCGGRFNLANPDDRTEDEEYDFHHRWGDCPRCDGVGRWRPDLEGFMCGPCYIEELKDRVR